MKLIERIHRHHPRALIILVAAAVIAACAEDGALPAPAEAEAELRSRAPRLIQPGDPTGFGALVAANASGARQVGASNDVWDVLRATGSVVSYADNPVFDPARALFASTADLVVADVDDPSAAPRVVSAGAHLEYYPSHDRQVIAFTTENEAQGPGLYVASARP